MTSIESSKMMIAAKIMTPTGTTYNGVRDGVSGVALGTCVGVGVAIWVEVEVSVCAGLGVALDVVVAVGVGVGVEVGVESGDGVGVGVGVEVGVESGDGVGVGVGVEVCVLVLTAKFAVNEPSAETALNW